MKITHHRLVQRSPHRPAFRPIRNDRLVAHALALSPFVAQNGKEVASTSVQTPHTFIDSLPAANVACNGASFVVLLAGLLALKRGQIQRHKQLMLTASALLGLFLAGYATRIALAGVTSYVGEHKSLYIGLLSVHMAIAIPSLLFLVPRTLYFGLKDRITQHRRLARWAAVGWIASSLTSIPVYLMLYG